MSFRPTVCGSCGKPLPIAAGAGRPRRFCSSKCRYAARRDRDKARSRAIDRPSLTMTRKPARADVVASLTMLVDPGTPAAAPEDQLARALLELRTVEAGLRRLAPELPPRLRGPAGRIAERIGRELERAFPEVV